MSRLRSGTSLWLHARKVEPVRAPALRGHHSADLAIIGGGITGCAAAHQLASAGARVVLIDAARIGRGSTAASTALLMQEPDADFGELAERYGASGAREIWETSRRAAQSLIRTLKALPGPYIGTHRHYPRHLFALGYGGNGMTFGFMAAQILARRVLGRALPGDELFRFNRA